MSIFAIMERKLNRCMGYVRKEVDRHVYIPEALWARLVKVAKRRKVSASAIVRELLAEALNGKDSIRDYVLDGQHSAAAVAVAKDVEATADILKDLR